LIDARTPDESPCCPSHGGKLPSRFGEGTFIGVQFFMMNSPISAEETTDSHRPERGRRQTYSDHLHRGDFAGRERADSLVGDIFKTILLVVESAA